MTILVAAVSSSVHETNDLRKVYVCASLTSHHCSALSSGCCGGEEKAGGRGVRRITEATDHGGPSLEDSSLSEIT